VHAAVRATRRLIDTVRPTIPLDAWRIAVDLETTRAIQDQPGTPAHGCQCDQCCYWTEAAANVLPKSLFDQFRRIGITPERPTDVYSPHHADDGEHFRITFHIAGRLLSGPVAWDETEHYGSQLRYRELAPWPDYLGIVVFAHKQTRYPAPTLPASCTSELIQVDMRMFVPASSGAAQIDTRRLPR
jgi:hypothetical protein